MLKRSLKYIFPGAFGDEVCTLQDVGGAQSLILNGTLADLIGNTVSFIQRGYCRTVSITSANDLSAQTFTVRGTQNGVYIQEDIAGPNAQTRYGGMIFDIITDISVDGAVAGVSVGSGFEGFYGLIEIDPYMSPNNYSLKVTGGGTIFRNNVTFDLYGSNDDLALNGFTYLDNIASNLAFPLTTSTNNLLFPDGVTLGGYTPYTPLVRSLLLRITGIEDNITRAANLTFLQSGI